MNIHTTSRLLYCILFTMLAASCSREVVSTDQIELGKEYFPLWKGKFVEYAVDSIIYNDFTKTTDTFSLQFRDEVADSFYDNQGRLSYKIQRTKRANHTQPWVDEHTYYATATNFSLEIVEQNLRFIKLIFPVRLNTRWEGNKYIPSTTSPELSWMSNWSYKYTQISEPFYNGINSFTDALVVSEQDSLNGEEGDMNNPSSYSALSYSKQVYAKHVGLVYKELTRWVYQENGSKYRSGFTLIFRATFFN